MSSARVEQLCMMGSVEAWRALGLGVGVDGLVPFLFTSLRIEESAGGDDGGGLTVGDGGGDTGGFDTGGWGIRAWAISGIDPSITDIDGLVTEVVDPSVPTMTEHPNGAIELDHVVVTTSSLDRTCGAIAEATGAPLKRVREVGAMRQGFHRVGSGGLIVEVVERPEITADHASFWGVVINVSDLDAAVDLIGPDRIGTPNDAVQPGRRIATVRAAAGLGVPVALMTP